MNSVIFSLKLILSMLLITSFKSLKLRLMKTSSITAINHVDKTRILHMSGTEWPVSRVRSQFIDYFTKNQNHVNYKSSPVVPVNDPTLLFANAGMNQFKPIFIGTVDPNSPLSELKRVVNSQKCIRAGGKHNDLDDVGKDTYHHTFFEMLGTWSFGDYFKAEAIDWAYDILVNTYKLPPERLYASYFGGDETLGLPADFEAMEYWLKYLPKERVLPFDKKANFWEMGETGPCGPCSEIHFDRIGGRNAATLVNADDPDVIEIWNLVFIQFNRELSGELRPLPDKHIDTGMGLERLTSILQNKRSNYDTDVFYPIFKAIQEKIGNIEQYTGKLGEEDAKQNYKDTAYRIIADHIRTLTFAITDGAVPSNEGRGYVLRRILRRAIRFGIQTLGAKPGFFSQLVDVVVSEFGNYYPELINKQQFVKEVLSDEEQSFSLLLQRGIKYFNDIINTIMENKQEKIITGETAFYLYDSLGFPIDLTQIMAKERGFHVNMEEFYNFMNIQKERGRLVTRAKRLNGLTSIQLDVDDISLLQKKSIQTTVDNLKYEYIDNLKTNLQIIYTSEKFKDSLTKQDFIDDNNKVQTIGLILESTTFYAESGGQISDTGIIQLHDKTNGIDLNFDVVDVQTYGGYILHLCVLSEESIDLVRSRPNLLIELKNLDATASVDYSRRKKVAPNHTMTHVLNYALRKVLATDVDQKGSQVTDEKLRFDFSLNRGMQINEVAEVEAIVNKIILDEQVVYNELLPLKKAQSFNGLRAVFGEVYPDPVRVISVGAKIDDVVNNPDSEEWLKHSLEFCGGTHISNTKEAEAFVILEETAVAKGIRRISAVTGEDAKNALILSKQIEDEVAQSTNLMKSIDVNKLDEIDAKQLNLLETSITTIRTKLDESVISYTIKSNLRTQIEKLQKELSIIKNKLILSKANEDIKLIISEVKQLVSNGAKTAVLSMNLGSDSKVTKKAIESIRKESSDSLSFLLIGIDSESNRINIFAFVNDESQNSLQLKANDWVNSVLSTAGGKGGGKANLANGSINDISYKDTIIKAANDYLVHNVKV